MKRIINALKKVLCFEENGREFELLENESGTPGFFGEMPHEMPHENRKSDADKPDILLDENIRRIMREFRGDINTDLIIRRFSFAGKTPAAAVFMNGMADGDSISDFILREGMRGGYGEPKRPFAEFAITNVFTMSEAKTEGKWKNIRESILEGLTVVLFDGESTSVVMDTRGYAHRGVETPQNEKVVRGPQEGFNEHLRTNITLLRRMIKTADLVCEIRDSGGENNLKAALMYREGIANSSLLSEVKGRMARIDTRMILNNGVLEQLTEKHSLSPFPQVLATERPDRAAANIMQGGVAVLLDGSPYANLMPITLFTLMASSEDVYLREPQGTVIRFVRFVGAIISILLPGLFLAMAFHHQGLLSTEVLSTVISSRRMVFASIGVEMLFLLVVFQLIREAGLRVPGSIGQAIGIIGGLILGQAAVAANLASSVILIVVALAGLGNFCIPDYSTQLSASYFRVIIALAGWASGFLGVTAAAVLILAWIASLKSYGVPFLSPFAPKTYTKHPMILRGRITMHERAADYVNTKGESKV